MNRIVLTTIGSLGDLHPMIAMGLELHDRGHEIVFATLKDYQAKIESLGFEFHSLRPDHISPEDPEMMALMMDLQKGSERIVRDYLFANIRETYIDLMVAARDADFS
jgi:rhamnosyltransferase subunit B